MTTALGLPPDPAPYERFSFRNWGIWFPPRRNLAAVYQRSAPGLEAARYLGPPHERGERSDAFLHGRYIGSLASDWATVAVAW